jgi:hypothetical protein
MWSIVITSMLPVGDKDVALCGGLVHRRDLIALHRRLQGADRVDLGDHDAGTLVLRLAAEPLPTLP